MRVRRGDVVLVDFLFSDRRSPKIRPCLAVQNDDRNQRLQDTIVAAISSNVTRANAEPTQVLVKINTTEGARTGLLFDSTVQCGNLATIDLGFVIRKIGSLSSTITQQVDDCLKTALGL